MKIIRTFKPKSFKNWQNLDFFPQRDYVLASKGVGEVVTPLVHPRLAWRYLGFQTHPEVGIAIALSSPQTAKPGNFFHFSNGQWKPTPTAIYQSPATIRSGMDCWMGPMQAHIQIQEGHILREVSVGYEVEIEPIEYMLNFAIPQWLSQPYRLNRLSRIRLDGTVELPKGYNPEQLLSAVVRPLEGQMIKASVSDKGIRPEVALTPQPVQVLFTVKPQVEFTEGLYQVEQSPCVVLRELEIKQYHSPYRYEPILSGSGGSELDFPVANFDFPVEVEVMATERKDAQAIANQIMHKVQDEGKIYLPPIDLTLGCYVEGGIGAGGGQETVPLELEGGMGAATPSNVRGGLPTTTFRLIFKNLAS